MTFFLRRMVFSGTAIFAGLVLGASGRATAAEPPAHSWGAINIAALRAELAQAEQEALPALDTRKLDAAISAGDVPAVDEAATDLALRLGRMILVGSASASERVGWKIADPDRKQEIGDDLAAALHEGRLPGFFASLRPRHPDYAALREAYAVERDPERRTQLARNLERWRWMPNDPGSDYVVVNTASFEVSLWRAGARIGTWPVVVGKSKTPTPVFSATITGVTLNPWWDVPANIVRESVGALVRKNPALARQRGYVWGGGRYRQRPGPGNSLGQMKLVMPNPYSVYLHDTPSKDLFGRDVRAFSHGCIRVGDALGFAKILLDGSAQPGDVDARVAAGDTVTIDLVRSLPVYITYFTAIVRSDGQLSLLPDIYNRDRKMGDVTNPDKRCAA